MKTIKDEDLLSLHDQIEAAETKQIKLQEILEEKNVKLGSHKRATRIFKIATAVLSVALIFLLMNAFLGSAPSVNDQIRAIEEKEMEQLREEAKVYEKNKADFEVVKELYLYRDLIDKDTVYSVQISSFRENKMAAISEKFINGKIYSDTSFFKLSLGIFETLPEAQQFRKTLIESGFSKRIFVISYKDGKRLNIESPN